MFKRITLVLTILALSAVRSDADTSQAANPAPTSFSILDARERGGFDIGSAVCGVSSVPDTDLGKNVLKFDFQASPKSHTGAWTKKYPRGLKAAVADAVKIGVKAPDYDLIHKIAVKVEVKGKKGWQTVMLHLKPGWNYYREPINWDGIGDLTEIVFVVSPIIREGQVEGILYFDATFFRLSFFQKYSIFVKAGWMIALALLLALMMALVRKTTMQKSQSMGAAPLAQSINTGSPGLKRDLLYGIVAVLIAGVATAIYFMGTVNPLDVGMNFNFLTVGLLGGLIGGVLKFGITGKSLKPSELLQDVLFVGMLAVSTSNLDILHAPSSWAQVLMLNSGMAALATVIYLISNGAALASSGRHLRLITGALLVGAPYALNWLMVMEDVTFVHGKLIAQPIVLGILGRLLVAFVFNEIVTNGISLITKGKILNTFKAHSIMLLVALGVAVSPRIAELGSAANVAALPAAVGALVAIVTAALSLGGLWAEVYLITGVGLDGGHRMAPTGDSLAKHVLIGTKKGIAFSAIALGLLFALQMLLEASLAQQLMASMPIALGTIAGALLFPLLKTIIETFDGSLPFFSRTRYSYSDVTLYARGAVAGYGFSYAFTHGFIQQPMSDRVLFGLTVGIVASAGMSLLRDAVYASRNLGSIQSWRLYLVDGLLGGFVGSALAFYLDALQVPVIVEKFKLYTSMGFEAREYITYPLVNKWGRIDLGTYSGGAKLLYTESLAGVINWSIAAWLFAINKVFLQSLFEKQTAPIKNFFSKDGFAALVENMIYVLRWGLWMSPIIFTFLRMMPDPTWYNQDGAVRTLIATYHNVTMLPAAFREWSLNVFVSILAFDFFRVLIWMDHMGLRVATLVNLSFIGMDKLDERIAKFIGPAAAQRYIPEGVKRFTTWAPLLIPFFLPRGQEWDYVWDTAEATGNATRIKIEGMLASIAALPLWEQCAWLALAVLVATGISVVLRKMARRSAQKHLPVYKLGNRIYRVFAKANGEVYSEVDHKKSAYPPEYDITRRSYDLMDPSGRILFVTEAAGSGVSQGKTNYWPVVGNFPRDMFTASRVERREDSLAIINTVAGIQTTVEITLPDKDGAAEIWKLTIENLTAQARQLKIVPYLEWVLNGGLHDRFHTQYARLFPEMEYVSGANAILAWQKSTKAMGIVATDTPAEGFLTSRMDFIGRAQSIWKPRVFETMEFLEARDTAAYPTFEPIGSLLLDASVGPKESKTIRMMIGYAKNRAGALEMINKYLKPTVIARSEATKPRNSSGQSHGESALLHGSHNGKKLLIGHGEILPGTTRPYSTYADGGNKLIVHTPYTPRPYDHAMSNAMHSVMVTNRGLHTTCNGNSQQNRLTPDWPDTVTKEAPAEAIYMHDADSKEWFSPTYHPLNEKNAKYESEFSVDGTAVFRMQHGTIATELTVFVPPQEPLGVYWLKVRNNSDRARRMRVAPFFQMVLEFQPERSGTLQAQYDKATDALYFNNPRNIFRNGWAFVSMSAPTEVVETNRGRFYGTGRGVAHPAMVENGIPDATQMSDDRQIASFISTLDVPAHGEKTVAIILGQIDSREDAQRLVQKYKNIEAVSQSLAETRAWWLSLMKTVQVETTNAQFNYYQNWLKYQALAERIWARRGFYQTSGAYGFRDQLQDTVNLMWVDPALARKQILLHASQQFLQGDVFHWFFTLTDGRTAFSCRSHASDNPVWLPWAVIEYLRATGDSTLLDEKTSYMWSEFPFADLPKNKEGWGHLYHRITRQDTVYKHCMRAIDLILKKRTGKNGLPLIQTGDWNDGLDEIGSHRKGESIWLGFFLYYILKDMVHVIGKKEGAQRKEYYQKKMNDLATALEKTWREDRYLRAFHDDGTEIGVKDSGIWETDALTAAWAVMGDINFERGLTAFNTALRVLERENTILLGWPALREDSKPYLGRSSKYPEGVRENGMYCHGVQWLVRAARILAEKFDKKGDKANADKYRETATRLWLKISPIMHMTEDEIELYGGQPNKQSADMLTTYDQGRMIWHGYTGAAGWMMRQAMEGVVGATLLNNEMLLPDDLDKPRGDLTVKHVTRDLSNSPLKNGLCSGLKPDISSNVAATAIKDTKAEDYVLNHSTKP